MVKVREALVQWKGMRFCLKTLAFSRDYIGLRRDPHVAHSKVRSRGVRGVTVREVQDSVFEKTYWKN